MSNLHLSAVRKIEDIKGPARAVLMVLADRADDTGQAWPSWKTLEKESGFKRTAIYGALVSLKSAGLIQWHQRKTDAGDFTSNMYLLTLGGSSPDERGSSGDERGSSPDEPQVVRQTNGGSSGDEPKASYEAPSEAPLFRDDDFPKARKTSSKKRDQETMAETIYQEYPRKESKKDGIKAILNTMKKHDPAYLLEKTKAYASAIGWKEKNFIPYPATWFNKERFNDNPEAWEESKPTASKPAPVPEGAAVIGGRTYTPSKP